MALNSVAAKSVVDAYCAKKGITDPRLKADMQDLVGCILDAIKANAVVSVTSTFTGTAGGSAVVQTSNTGTGTIS